MLVIIKIFVLAFFTLSNASPWSSIDGTLYLSGKQVSLKGFAVTCTEYLLRGIGTSCFATYNWNDPSNIITTINRAELDAVYANLLPAPEGVVPTLRYALTAAYWLDVSTSAWSNNRNQYPNLALQYRTLIEKLVQDATSRGIVVILDLHWNNDVDSQQEMAQKGSSKGDSMTFWTQIGAKFKDNPYVFYELYNEPHTSSYSVWKDGSASFEGMKPLTEALHSLNVKGMILIAGAYAWAYDAASLVQFTNEMDPQVMQSTMFVVHPYMGPYQAGDSKKNVDGYINLLNQLSMAKRPIIATEFGQYCCASEGACYAYNGVYSGKNVGYVHALLLEMTKRGISWTAWAYRPNSGSGDCNQPDANDGKTLFNSDLHSGQGANYKVLFPLFYPQTVAPSGSTNSPVSRSPTVATTQAPVTKSPTKVPTPNTKSPTKLPSQLSNTKSPTKVPTQATITKSPTKLPSQISSTKSPTKLPTQVSNTKSPTRIPTMAPATKSPSVMMTKSPSINSSTKSPTIATCAATWGQCAGTGFATRSCCSPTDGCVYQNAYYSQCVPNANSTPATNAPTGTPQPTSTCSSVWQQCGGINFIGNKNCCTGTSCEYLNDYYSQCKPSRLLRGKHV